MGCKNNLWRICMRLKHKHRKLLIDILIIIGIIAGLLLIYLGLRFFLATDTPIVVIASGSMSPALEVGDLAVVQGVSSSDIQIGDMIVFDSPEGVRTIHRVTQMQTLLNGTILFKTKGDANPSEESYWTSEKDVHGRVIFRIPYIGWLALIPAIPITIVVILLIIILLWPENRRKRKKLKL